MNSQSALGRRGIVSIWADGVDPVEERAQRRAALAVERRKLATLRDTAEQWLRSREPGWRGGAWASQWEAILARYVYPEIGDLPVASIGTAEVLAVIEPMWKAQTVTASRLLGVLARILDAARLADRAPVQVGHLVGADHPGLRVALAARLGLQAREANRRGAGRLVRQGRFVDVGRIAAERQAEALEQLAPVLGARSEDERRSRQNSLL